MRHFERSARGLVVAWLAVIGVCSGCAAQRCRSRPFEFDTCDRALARLPDAEHEQLVAELWQRDRTFCASSSSRSWVDQGGAPLGADLSLEGARTQSCVAAALEAVRAHVSVSGRRSRLFELPAGSSRAVQVELLTRIPLAELPAEARAGSAEAQCVGLVVRALMARVGLFDEPTQDDVEGRARQACELLARDQRRRRFDSSVRFELADLGAFAGALRTGRRHLFRSDALEAGRARAQEEARREELAARQEAMRALAARAAQREAMAPREALAALDVDVTAAGIPDEALVYELTHQCLSRVNAREARELREVTELPLRHVAVARARTAWLNEVERRLAAEIEVLGTHPFARAHRAGTLLALRSARATVDRTVAVQRGRPDSSAGSPELLRLERLAQPPEYLLRPAVTMEGTGVCAVAPLRPPDPTLLVGEATFAGLAQVEHVGETRRVSERRRLPDTVRYVEEQAPPKAEPWMQCIRDSMGRCPSQKPRVVVKKVVQGGRSELVEVEKTVMREEVLLTGRLTVHLAERHFVSEVRASARADNLHAACRDAARVAIMQVLDAHRGEFDAWLEAALRRRLASATNELDRIEAELALDVLSRRAR